MFYFVYLQMPKLLIIGKFTFSIFPSDIDESRKHIHILSKKGRKYKFAKIWIEKEGVFDIEIAKQGDFSEVEINKITKLLEENHMIIEKQLDDYFSGKKIKTIKLK